MIISRSATIRIRKNKEKLVKMFGLVVVIFVICWAPYHIYFIYSYHDPSITQVYWLLNTRYLDPNLRKLYISISRFPTLDMSICFSTGLQCVKHASTLWFITGWTGDRYIKWKLKTQTRKVCHKYSLLFIITDADSGGLITLIIHCLEGSEDTSMLYFRFSLPRLNRRWVELSLESVFKVLICIDCTLQM